MSEVAEDQPIGLSSKVAYLLSDITMLRIFQRKPGEVIKAEGSLVWVAPWGARVDLLEKAVVRQADDGSTFVFLEMIGNLYIVAGVHYVGYSFFLILDKSKGKFEVPKGNIPNTRECLNQLQPMLISGYSMAEGEAWVKIEFGQPEVE